MTTTIELPDGQTAEMWGPRELTPRRRRPVELLSALAGRSVTALRLAPRIYCDDVLIEDRSEVLDEDKKPVFTGRDAYITRAQLALVSEMNDATAWALLKSWTLPDPLPATPDALLDIPAGVYDALRAAAASIVAGNAADVFGPDALGDDPDTADPSLPTSASAG